MSYDDWKCSPPCPACASPNCFCDEADESEPERCDFACAPGMCPAEVTAREIAAQSEMHHE